MGAGPKSRWQRHGRGTDWQQLCSRALVAPFTSIVLLGIPYQLSAPHCEAARPQLERLGLVQVHTQFLKHLAEVAVRDAGRLVGIIRFEHAVVLEALALL